MGDLNVDLTKATVPLQLDMSDQFSYLCTHGRIEGGELVLMHDAHGGLLKEHDKVYVYQYLQKDDLNKVYRYDLHLLQ